MLRILLNLAAFLVSVARRLSVFRACWSAFVSDWEDVLAGVCAGICANRTGVEMPVWIRNAARVKIMKCLWDIMRRGGCR